MQLKSIKSAILTWGVLGVMLQLSSAVQAQVVPSGFEPQLSPVSNQLQKPNPQVQPVLKINENVLQKQQGQVVNNSEQNKLQAPLNLGNLRESLQKVPRNPAEYAPMTCGNYNLH